VADLGRDHRAFGPWTGLNESDPGSEEVRRALNVIFENGRVSRRPGRALVGTLSSNPLTGLFQHVSITGERILLAAFTPAAAAPILGTVDASTDALTALTLPTPAGLPDPLTPWGFTSFKGWTILSTPGEALLRFDGATVAALEAVQGADKASGLVGARSYLAAPPPARTLLMWRSRLVAIGRQTVGLSATSGDINIPSSAPVGAPNVWPVRQNFDVLTRDGDEVMGGAIRGDQLVIFTRRGVILVDEDEVSPVARIVSPTAGCVAPGSIQVGGKEGSLVFYLSDGRVLAFDGNDCVDISSGPLRDTLQMVNWACASRAVSVHLASKNEYRIWLPVSGSTSNRLCLIYNYVRKAWRVAAGWYPWADESVQSANQPFDVTAACAILDPSDREILVTGDSSGRLWIEDVNEDDAGSVFPAFFALDLLGQDERTVSFGDIRLDALQDGSWLEVYGLPEGRRLEEELARQAASVALRSERAIKRSLREDHLTFDAAGCAWNVSPHIADPGSMVFSVRRNTTRFQPVVLMPGTDGSIVDTAAGGVAVLEIAVRMIEQGRGSER
jgi:hypothetical protein